MTVREFSRLLLNGDDFLLLTHQRPDGDTLGSAVALCHALRQKGKRAWLYPNEDVTPRYDFICRGFWASSSFSPGCIVSVDVAAPQQLTPSASVFANRIDLCIDHHPTSESFAEYSLVEPGAAATGELVWQLICEMGVSPTLEIYTALYLAVSTDTGCFRYSNTTPLSHEIAARCIAAGCDFHSINREFFEKKSMARLALERHLLSNLIFAAEDRVASVYIPRSLIDSLRATDDDLDNLSTLTMQVGSILCGIVLVETKDRAGYKASVRTQAPLDAGAICQAFGGGGHARAAGCTLTGTGGERARQMLEREAVRRLQENHV